jgi:TRAP-type mannitol/chloroaromatic compound transport system substrate-binding protein
LPPQYQDAIKTAAYQANATMLARYDARNNQALQSLIKSGVKLRPYTEEILRAAEQASFALYDEFAAKDPDFKAVYQEWQQFRDRIYAWHKLNESSFTNFVYSQIKN